MADETTASIAATDGTDAAAAATTTVTSAGAEAAAGTGDSGAAATPASASGSGSATKADAKADKPSEAEADATTDAEIEAMKKRVKEMEDEAKKIEDLQTNAEKALKPKTAPAGPSGPDVDARSVYVGNVDYSTTPEELQEFFSSCGIVNRITILCDKFTGHPKGYAYVEFKDTDAIANAMLLNDSDFKGRPLKVSQKRTNLPGLAEYRGGGGGGRRPRGGRAPARGGGGFRSPTRGSPAAYASYPSYGAAPRARFRHRRFTSPYSR